jgi:hypothetical protein
MGLLFFAWAFVGLVQDEVTFAKITHFYRTTFPTADFQYNWHMGDGPRGGHMQLHVAVPQAVEKEHLHRFGLSFLQRKVKSANALDRKVAEDLLHLRKPLRFTYECTSGYGDNTMVECTSYVVDLPEKFTRYKARPPLKPQ